MSNASLPEARHGHTMVYDSGHDRTIVFGGYATGYCNSTWTFDMQKNAWSNATAGIAPPARLYHSAAFDSKGERMVVFGGSDSKSIFNDTWLFDPASSSWKNASPAKSPTSRERAAMAYDAESDRVVLFGGWTGKGYSNETWTYDLGNNTWKNMTFLTNPKGRVSHALAYDSQADRVVMFGGKTSALGFSDETWGYDLNINKWTNLTTSSRPGAKLGHALAYDSKNDRVVMFGGLNTNETWSYNFSSNAWTFLKPVSAPFGRSEHAMSYDSRSDRIVLFGGDMGGDEVWLFDASVPIWTNTNPDPASRFGHSLAYDSAGDRVVLFGGTVAGLVLADDTWSYDPGANAWKNMNPFPRPSPRSGTAMAYDSKHGCIVLFGGTTAPNQFSNETWSYDLKNNSWTDMKPSDTPQVRAYHALAYDSARGRVVLFGGNAANETWAYDLGSNSWKKMSPASSPSARSLASMSYDSESDRIVMYGGNASGKSNGETWAYDPGNDTWMEMDPLTSPGPRESHSMVYSSAVDRTVLFGGVGSGKYYNETWTYDLNKDSWERLETLVSPSPRARAGMAYDAGKSQVVLFGGMTATEPRSGETWTCSPPGNVPPDAPVITGPQAGFRGAGLAYSVSANDANGDSVRYVVDWGDGSKNATGHSPSGSKVPVLHAWSSIGMYKIAAKAIDERGTFSAWSVPLGVTITAVPVPVVKNATPADGATNVSTNTKLTIEFSRVMNSSATEGAVTSTPTIGWTVSWSVQGTVFELTPTAALKAGTKYTVMVSTDAMSKDGAHLASTYTFSFTTAISEGTPPNPLPTVNLDLMLIFLVLFVIVVIILAVLGLSGRSKRVKRDRKRP